MVALPGQLFTSRQIPACLWFLARNRRGGDSRALRDRRGQILFIDARKMGRIMDRTHRELTDQDIARFADTYRSWRAAPVNDLHVPEGEGRGEGYADIAGFCKSADLEEVRRHGHVLTPGRYVGVEPQPDDGIPFEMNMAKLTAQWREQQVEAARLDAAIEENLRSLGFIEEVQRD